MPLSALDETLMHQAPTTMDQTMYSDHRFFDRMVVGCHHDGEAALIMGFAAYKNMNTMEGFAVMQKGDKQYNLRLSRALRPELAHDLNLGPLSVETLEPLQKLRLRLGADKDRPTSFDLIWDGLYPAHEEGHHLNRRDGRVYQDYMRFDQVGVVNGWMEIEGEKIQVKDWYTFRDHSWGVRPGVGGYEPVTGDGEEAFAGGVNKTPGSLFIWLAFWAEGVGGQFQAMEDGEGVQHMVNGHFAFPAETGKPNLRVVDLEHDISFIPGTRVYDKVSLLVTTDDGQKWEIEAEAMGRSWVFKGTGYDSGYDDEKSLGFYRGKDLSIETDVYDISHAEDAGLPDGRIIRPVHREQPARLTVNGKPGYGHFPVINRGEIKRYGLK